MEHIPNEAEARLLYALVERRGLQEIIDIASELLENPVFVSDLGYKIICRSELSKENDDDDFSGYVKEHAYSMPDKMVQIMRSGDLAKIYSSDEVRTGQYPFARFPFIAARIYDGKQNLGHIFVYGSRRTFTEEDRNLLSLLCRIVSYEMLYRGMSTPYRIPYYSLLTDLLEGKLTDKAELEQRLKCLKLKISPDVHVAVVRFENVIGQTSIFYIRTCLNRKLPQILSIIYNDSLVLLAEGRILKNGVLEDFFRAYEVKPGCRIGISDTVENLLALKIYYCQAICAIEIGEHFSMEKCLYYYRQLYVYQQAHLLILRILKTLKIIEKSVVLK